MKEVSIVITGGTLTGKTTIANKILELFADDVLQGEVIHTEEEDDHSFTKLTLEQHEGTPIRYFIAEVTTK